MVNEIEQPEPKKGISFSSIMFGVLFLAVIFIFYHSTDDSGIQRSLVYLGGVILIALLYFNRAIIYKKFKESPPIEKTEVKEKPEKSSLYYIDYAYGIIIIGTMIVMVILLVVITPKMDSGSSTWMFIATVIIGASIIIYCVFKGMVKPEEENEKLLPQTAVNKVCKIFKNLKPNNKPAIFQYNSDETKITTTFYQGDNIIIAKIPLFNNRLLETEFSSDSVIRDVHATHTQDLNDKLQQQQLSSERVRLTHKEENNKTTSKIDLNNIRERINKIEEKYKNEE